MDKQEYAAWLAWTARSQYHWKVDPVHNGIGNDLLVHIGGTDGRYVQITAAGRLSIGEYVGAVPHIGEAIFTERASKKFASYDAALTRAIEACGMRFLLDILNIDVYPTVLRAENPREVATAVAAFHGGA